MGDQAGFSSIPEKDLAIALNEKLTAKTLDALYAQTSESILWTVPSFNQLMLVFSQASFASSEQEQVDVASIVLKYIRETEIFPLVSKHEGLDLASRCLISLGLFKDKMVRSCNYHAAPTPEFYRNVGVSQFKILQRYDLSRNFTRWENFLGEFFC